MKKAFWMMISGAILFGSCSRKSADSSAAIEESPKEVFSTNNGAIDGYDPVAFFLEGKPVKGEPKFSEVWHGATWHFSSQENLEAFRADEEKYAPQYGGYCAYGTANGHKAPTQPDAWALVDGKLYFNYSKDVQVKWFKNQKELIEAADKNWPEVKQQPD